ncbi:hypothetical protein [Phaeacidiphilus oryzae]|nr:hypothetical protein [Phaeacidiphilus oryzae]
MGCAPTGRLRIGFSSAGPVAGLEAGRHVLRDPEGRAVEVVVGGGAT